MLVDALPLLDGWRDIGYEILEPITIKKGTEYNLYTVSYPGWLYSLQVTVSGDDDVIFVIDWYDPIKGLKMAQINPLKLISLGFTEPNPSAPYVSYYDIYKSEYTIAFTPAMPLPFKASPDKPRSVYVKAVSNDVTITDYSQEGFVIYDKSKFINSLNKIYKR